MKGVFFQRRRRELLSLSAKCVSMFRLSFKRRGGEYIGSISALGATTRSFSSRRFLTHTSFESKKKNIRNKLRASERKKERGEGEATIE